MKIFKPSVFAVLLCLLLLVGVTVIWPTAQANDSHISATTPDSKIIKFESGCGRSVIYGIGPGNDKKCKDRDKAEMGDWAKAEIPGALSSAVDGLAGKLADIPGIESASAKVAGEAKIRSGEKCCDPDAKEAPKTYHEGSCNVGLKLNMELVAPSTNWQKDISEEDLTYFSGFNFDEITDFELGFEGTISPKLTPSGAIALKGDWKTIENCSSCYSADVAVGGSVKFESVTAKGEANASVGGYPVAKFSVTGSGGPEASTGFSGGGSWKSSGCEGESGLKLTSLTFDGITASCSLQGGADIDVGGMDLETWEIGFETPSVTIIEEYNLVN